MKIRTTPGYRGGYVTMARELFSAVSRKWQIALPAEIRAALGIRQGERVAFSFEDALVEEAVSADSVKGP